jgi:hypothetical protein
MPPISRAATASPSRRPTSSSATGRALKDSGIGKKESVVAQALADLKTADPGLHEQVRSGEASVKGAVAVVRRRRGAEAKAGVEDYSVKFLRLTAPQFVNDKW